MLDTLSELLVFFGAFAPVSVEQEEEQVSGQRDTQSLLTLHNEQVTWVHSENRKLNT